MTRRVKRCSVYFIAGAQALCTAAAHSTLPATDLALASRFHSYDPSSGDRHTTHADGEADEPLQVGDQAAEKYSLRFTPYAWLTSFNGDVNAQGVEFDIDLSFRDVLDSSDTVLGLMGAIDLEVGRLVFQLNGTYTHAEQSNQRGRALGDGAVTTSAEIDADISMTWLEFFAGYRLVERAFGQGHGFTIDAFGGVRYTDLDLNVSVVTDATVTLPRGRVLTAGERRRLDREHEWFEPFLGARAAVTLHDGWSFSARGDVGGFDVDGSNLAWQVVTAVGHEWLFQGGSFGAFAGYRLLQQDYESGDGFEWDVLTHGPLLGATLRFWF